MAVGDDLHPLGLENVIFSDDELDGIANSILVG